MLILIVIIILITVITTYIDRPYPLNNIVEGKVNEMAEKYQDLNIETKQNLGSSHNSSRDWNVEGCNEEIWSGLMTLASK